MEIIIILVSIAILYGIIRGAVEEGTYAALVKFDKYKQKPNNKLD